MSSPTSLASATAKPVTATATAPIGVFDSGIGGLSVAQEIALHLPQEKILYFADTLHVPYGVRSDDNIRELTAQAVDWLFQHGCKAVVVACNTASAFSLDYLREQYGAQFPIIGLVPALKPAVLQSRSKVVAVLATAATFRGQLLQDVMTHFAQPAGVRVIPVICHELVPLVEAGLANSPQSHALLKSCLADAVAQGADTLVLGCTHYPFLKQAIQRVYPQLHLLDSGMAVARQTARVLIQHQLKSEQAVLAASIQINCVVSGHNAAALTPIVTPLINEKMTWRIQNIEV